MIEVVVSRLGMDSSNQSYVLVLQEKDGTRMLPFPMDWPSFSTMKASDLDAVVAYLRTVPPVRNKVPRPSTTVLPLFLWGKFQMLILGEDIPSFFYAGNAGITSGDR